MSDTSKRQAHAIEQRIYCRSLILWEGTGFYWFCRGTWMKVVTLAQLEIAQIQGLPWKYLEVEDTEEIRQ